MQLCESMSKISISSFPRLRAAKLGQNGGMDEGNPAQHSNIGIFKKRCRTKDWPDASGQDAERRFLDAKRRFLDAPIFFRTSKFQKKVQDVSGRSVLGVCALTQFQPLQ